MVFATVESSFCWKHNPLTAPNFSIRLRERQGKLEGVEGFQKFLLLKKCEYQKYQKQPTLESTTTSLQTQQAEHVEYLAQSFWAHKLDFYSYIESDYAARQRIPPGLSSFLVNEEQPKGANTYETVFSDPILPEGIGGNVVVAPHNLVYQPKQR